jgi:hypothetical protein
VKTIRDLVSGHELSLLESRKLNLLDQDRFIGLFSADSDPVPTALSHQIQAFLSFRRCP